MWYPLAARFGRQDHSDPFGFVPKLRRRLRMPPTVPVSQLPAGCDGKSRRDAIGGTADGSRCGLAAGGPRSLRFVDVGLWRGPSAPGTGSSSTGAKRRRRTGRVVVGALLLLPILYPLGLGPAAYGVRREWLPRGVAWRAYAPLREASARVPALGSVLTSYEVWFEGLANSHTTAGWEPTDSEGSKINRVHWTPRQIGSPDDTARADR